MGSCLGHCRLSKESFSFYKFYSKASDTVDIQISDLGKSDSVEYIINDSQSLHSKDEFNFSNQKTELKKSHFRRLKSIFSNIRSHYNVSSDVRLELLDDEWSLTEADCSARTESLVYPSRYKENKHHSALLMMVNNRGCNFSSAKMKGDKTQNSISVNSLDLEWEHLPEMAVFSSNVEKEEPQSATSVGGWSRLSSADSLEWDPAEIEVKEEIDTETEQLLQEIEMLSSKTLQETQEWAS